MITNYRCSIRSTKMAVPKQFGAGVPLTRYVLSSGSYDNFGPGYSATYPVWVQLPAFALAPTNLPRRYVTPQVPNYALRYACRQVVRYTANIAADARDGSLSGVGGRPNQAE